MKCYQEKMDQDYVVIEKRNHIKNNIDNRKPLGSKENPHPFEKGKKIELLEIII